MRGLATQRVHGRNRTPSGVRAPLWPIGPKNRGSFLRGDSPEGRQRGGRGVPPRVRGNTDGERQSRRSARGSGGGGRQVALVQPGAAWVVAPAAQLEVVEPVVAHIAVDVVDVEREVTAGACPGEASGYRQRYPSRRASWSLSFRMVRPSARAGLRLGQEKWTAAGDGTSNGTTAGHDPPRSRCWCGILRWARLGSNQRPLACEASALPLSYAPEAACSLAFARCAHWSPWRSSLAGRAGRCGASTVDRRRASPDR